VPRLRQSKLDPIAECVAHRGRTHTVLPALKQMFAAMHATPFRSVRAVILRQDPYPNPKHAMGLAFSVPNDVKRPLTPSRRAPASRVRVRLVEVSGRDRLGSAPASPGPREPEALFDGEPKDLFGHLLTTVHCQVR
jgi:hypothetical protein